MAILSFKPKQVTKKILSELHERAYDVVFNRFGLGDDAERKTLESIGGTYGITRERVRQIENAALTTIRKGDTYREQKLVWDELTETIRALGGIVSEEELLSYISEDPTIQNHIHLYLVLGEQFTKHKENENLKSRWSVDPEATDKIHDSLKELYQNLSDDELLSENEIVSRFMSAMKDISDKYRDEEIARRWLRISKRIAKNPLGEWGKVESANIKTRGIKDYAYLMMRNHGSPMHFKEVALAICDTFGKDTNVATCHNELIKDARFVLVGRGIYALTDWGYKTGVVRDVIRDIIKKNGPMNKEDIVDMVMKERYLKKNTILVNLQNNKYFKKNKSGLYALA